MVMRFSFLIAALAALFCVVPVARAADVTSNQSPARDTQVSNFIGTAVSNLQGQKVGQIKDILFDPLNGHATFVILDASIAGSGRAMLVVPYPALQVSVDAANRRHSVVLDLRPEHLRTAPQIQNNQLQALQNPQFLEQARDFYGPMPYTAARPIDSANPPPPRSPAESESGWTQDLIDFYNE